MKIVTRIVHLSCRYGVKKIFEIYVKIFHNKSPQYLIFVVVLFSSVCPSVWSGQMIIMGGGQTGLNKYFLCPH